jgi:hypothetical protein
LGRWKRSLYRSVNGQWLNGSILCYPDWPSMQAKLRSALAVLMLSTLVACGIPGAPQPPSLALPRTVQDLKATRKGDRVTLTWTTPRQTTEHSRIKHLGATRICRAVDVVTPAECVEKVGTVSPAPLAAAVSFTDTLPRQLQEMHSTGFASYAVEVENTHGRSAGLSNRVMVPLAPTLPPPDRISASVTSEGVKILASGLTGPRLPSGLHIEIHLYRRSQGTTSAVDLGGPLWRVGSGFGQSMEFLDRTAEWEKTYLYKVAGVTIKPVRGVDERIEGDDSGEIEVFVHDTFPPAVPTGLEAVSSGTPQQPFIDLSWAPNTESDLAGYNVYRHEEGGEPKKINGELVKGPTYRDTAVQAGHRYWYSVSAVDLRGNESGRSTEASETVQQ